MIIGLADGTPLPANMQTCKGVVERVLFPGWFLLRATNSLPFNSMAYNPLSTVPEIPTPEEPNLAPLLVHRRIISDASWRARHSAACNKARLQTYALCSHLKAIHGPRVEMLGCDRSNRQIYRFFGEVDEAWTISPDTVFHP